MENKHIQILVEKYIDGTASPEEEAALMEWYNNSNQQDIEWLGLEEEEKEKLRLNILKAIHEAHFESRKKKFGWFRVAAAAAVLVSLSVGGYFLFHKQTVMPAPEEMVAQAISPGSSGATLVLSNGQSITLGASATGTIARQGQTTLQKQNDSLLVYLNRGKKTVSSQEIEYNTLKTSRGHQYSLILPDGTKVWLNAASSLKYPTAFTGKIRTVKLSGEAYFEVVHDAGQPFRVVTSKQVVKDIGTHFNVNAYPEDSVVKTTLLEGAVKVTLTDNQASRLLHPGEQAVADQQINVRKVDVSAAVAWKNGQFIFRSTPVKSIMQQVARWYDVEVIYKDDEVADRSVWGSVSRYAQVSEVLDMIELTGVAHFKIDGHKIIVTQ